MRRLPRTTAFAQTPPGVEKLNAYVGCINRLSARSYDSRSRYFSWAAKSGPTGKERIIYGTYTIYDTSDCVKNVEKANGLEPRDAALEAAATAYAKAVRQARAAAQGGRRLLHARRTTRTTRWPRAAPCIRMLVAAWDAFESADKTLRSGVEAINDRRALEKLAAIEQSEGKQARYHVEALMIQAKRVLRAEDSRKARRRRDHRGAQRLEGTVKGAEQFAGSGSDAKIGSFFMSNAKSFLTTAKQLMRRIRDHVPYSRRRQDDARQRRRGWMVEGSPPRLMRDYNQLVDAYNRGARI